MSCRHANSVLFRTCDFFMSPGETYGEVVISLSMILVCTTNSQKVGQVSRKSSAK